MCSISSTEPNKKRKNENSDSIENENKKQMKNLPSTESVSNLLVQALQSSDENLILDVLSKKDEILNNTIENLPNLYVEQLFHFIQKNFYQNGNNINYVKCLKKLFQSKISQILNIPNIKNQLMMLSDTLDIRCDLLDRCYKLKGRLDLMFLMLNEDDKPVKEENVILYEESSSESDNNDSENEDEEIMNLMNSDDELQEEESLKNGNHEIDEESDAESLNDDSLLD